MAGISDFEVAIIVIFLYVGILCLRERLENGRG
jgi:hypothetical protein